jgi:hypothetical protein
MRCRSQLFEDDNYDDDDEVVVDENFLPHFKDFVFLYISTRLVR